MIEKAASPAQVYDRFFLPALFGAWGPVLVDAAGAQPGERLLDVACGTGALACAAAARVGPRGVVVGLDPNEDMLSVARGKGTQIEWRMGCAEALPFEDASFDRVASQFGYMFFEDRPRALREMMRVLRPRGRLAVAVCDALDHSAGYAVPAELLHRLFGAQVAEAFRAPFALGDRRQLLADCAAAGIDDPRVERVDGEVGFPSVAALVSAERACVWTLGGLLDDDQFERLREAAEESLQPFRADHGQVSFVMPALIIRADK